MIENNARSDTKDILEPASDNKAVTESLFVSGDVQALWSQSSNKIAASTELTGTTLETNTQQLFAETTSFEEAKAPDNEFYTDDDGNSVVKSRGNRSQDHFELLKTPEGKLKLRETDGKLIEFSDSGSQVEDREELLKLVDKNITDPRANAKFKADMLRFEERASSSKYLSEGDVSASYKQLARFFDSDKTTPVSNTHNLLLAQQVLGHMANITAIGQGNHKTCNVTTVDTKVYTRYPQLAAGLVADVAMDGKYTAKDGTEVNIVDSTYKPDEEARNLPQPDGVRNYATQISNITAINGVYQSMGTGLQYHQREPFSRRDTGEYKIDLNADKFSNMRSFTGLKDIEIQKAWELITGNKEDIVMNHVGYGNQEGDNIFANLEQFKAQLEQFKKDDNFPQILRVQSGIEPFWNGGENPSWHVVTIKDYDPKTGLAQVDNQWSEEQDFIKEPLAVDVLYRATSPRAALDHINAKGKKDPEFQHTRGLEYEKLGLRTAELEQEEIAISLPKKLEAATKYWQSQEEAGKPQTTQREEFLKDFNNLFWKLHPNQKLAVVDTLYENGIFSEEEVNDRLFRIARDSYITHDLVSGDKEPNPNSAGKDYVYGIRDIANKLPEEARASLIERLKPQEPISLNLQFNNRWGRVQKSPF